MVLPVSLVGNGRYVVLVRPTGTGFSAWDGLALTGFSADRTVDGGGLVVYLRDVAADRLWSIGAAPAGEANDHYAVTAAGGVVTIAREDGDLATTLDTWVAADADVELRRIVIRNRGAAMRVLEVSTYAEIVLHDPASHLGHPAFAKLFVQTEARDGMLLARRRPRSQGDATPCLVHAFLGPGTLEHDTDRARVLGRGHDLRGPCALASSAPLAGTTGSVLDPVLCLRRRIEIPAGGTVRLALVLGAGASLDDVVTLGRRFASVDDVERAAPSTEGATTPLPPPLEAAAAVVHDRASHVAAVACPPRMGERPADGFSADGREYVVHVDPRDPAGPRLPPMPWVNVIANPTVGCIASETGAGCTWSRNSREHRLTPWANDPIADPHGEALWLRDEDTGRVWSAQPGPTPADVAYECRHGLGVSRWSHAVDELGCEVIVFVAADDPVKLASVRLTNRSARIRRVAVVSYAQLVLGVDPGAPLETERLDGNVLLARSPRGGDFAGGVAFAAAIVPDGTDVSATTDRTAFIGRGGTVASPAALASAGGLDGRAGESLDPCFALRATLTITPGDDVVATFLLGEVADAEAARALTARYAPPGVVGHALAYVRERWRAVTSAIEVSTPSVALDRMLNGWLLYQTLACRLWGRSALYQSGGAFGFRDQLQDAMALVYARPELTRAQIVLHAGHQFVEGDVLHWWHPPASRGMRTRFADDLLWLPYVTAFYVADDGRRRGAR